MVVEVKEEDEDKGVADEVSMNPMQNGMTTTKIKAK